MLKPKPPTFREFDARFPDDDACLDHLMRVRYGQRFECAGCHKQARYYRLKGKGRTRAYACEWCARQVFPTAGTPFENTRTPLRDWFLVMFLFVSSRNGVAAKEIQRTLGVTYKCAHRMGHKIREYMGYVDGDAPIGGPGGGPVEIDETFVGGPDKQGEDDKHIAIGMVERGGDVVAKHIPDRTGATVAPVILQHVKPGSRVMTDEARVYRALSADFSIESVNHSRKEWARGDVHTNTIEAFWANVKAGIGGTYRHVSSQHFQKYLSEFEYRHNMRRCPHLMLDALLISFSRP